MARKANKKSRRPKTSRMKSLPLKAGKAGSVKGGSGTTTTLSIGTLSGSLRPSDTSTGPLSGGPLRP